MRVARLLFSLSLAMASFASTCVGEQGPAPAQNPTGAPARRSPLAFQPPGVQAPTEPEEDSVLKAVRLTGAATAGAGFGLLSYAVFVEVAAGPVGWAAALIFFGGLSAYLAHRAINGEDDFRPTGASPKPR